MNAMNIESRGEILVTVKVENLRDLFDDWRGILDEGKVRLVEVDDAQVDTGATGFAMPKRLIERLGLVPVRTRKARTGAGIVNVQVYGPARLTIQGRSCPTEVVELSDDDPVRIDRVSLLALDLVVDPVNHRLIADPEPGLEPFIELY
jgi:predicted aspartyl protease